MSDTSERRRSRFTALKLPVKIYSTPDGAGRHSRLLMNTTVIVSKIKKLCKNHQHGLFVGLCLIITAGIGYNIGRIIALHASPGANGQSANISDTTKGNTNFTKTAHQIKITLPSPIPTDPRVVASKAAGSKLYHHPWCSGAQRIKETNKLWFPTEANAISAGYTLAGNCQ